MPRRRIVRRTRGKDPRVMTGSNFTSSIDGGVINYKIVEPTRDTAASGTGTSFATADFRSICSPNSIIKYINIRLQHSIKSDEAEFRPGWIEYGVVQFENQTGDPVTEAAITSNLGTQTLGELLRNLYRNHMIWNDAIPISVETPIVANIHLKIPPKYCKNMRGTFWILFLAFRSSKTTDSVTTVANRISHEYKVYI